MEVLVENESEELDKKDSKFLLSDNAAKIYLRRSYTNVFVTLTDLADKVIACKTSGMSGITGSKRRKNIPQAIESIMKVLYPVLKLYKIKNVTIVLKMRINIFFHYLQKELVYYNINILGYCMRRAVAFNGVKGRKLRRV